MADPPSQAERDAEMDTVEEEIKLAKQTAQRDLDKLQDTRVRMEALMKDPKTAEQISEDDVRRLNEMELDLLCQQDVLESQEGQIRRIRA